MSRLRRVLYCDRVAHCFIHAVDGIWFNDKDLQVLLELLKKLNKKHHFKILYYNLMSTHAHFVLQFSEDVSCGWVMSIIDGNMAKAYNKVNHRQGHLWRERYKDVTVETETHLWSVILYVALNKLKAKMIHSPEEDTTSSYPAYAQGIDDGITTLVEDYLECGHTPEECQAEFRRMVDEAWQRFQDAQAWDTLDHHDPVELCGGRALLSELLAMSDNEDAQLEKYLEQDKQANTPPQSKGLSIQAQTAKAKARKRREDLAIQRAKRLVALGVPYRAIQLFMASDDYIVDFVHGHKPCFDLDSPSP